MQTAFDAAVVLVILSIGTRLIRRRWARVTAAAAWETALVCAVYALWQLVGDMARTRVTGGISHGYAVWHFERAIHLPSEAGLQHFFLPHHLIIQFANLFYASVHLNSMWIFLVWLWVRHRDHYPYWRNVVVFSTGFCLLLQMIPVAPPRFLDGIGVIDTPLLYHQSVYGAFGQTIAQQLSAMPSVHVGWAVLIAYAVIKLSPSRWRWLVLVHLILTNFVVAVTGNHFWLDGVAAAAFVVLAMYVERGRLAASTAIAARIGPRIRALIPVPQSEPV
jgi:PAP2 superfamily